MHPRSGADGAGEPPVDEPAAGRGAQFQEAVVGLASAAQRVPPSVSSEWRASLLVLCGEALRHVGDVAPARAAFLEAANLSTDPALLARAALGYADQGADLGIAYRTHDVTSVELLERALAAQTAAETATVVDLEARLAAELYFSDLPGRSHELLQHALERARWLGDPRALCTVQAVVHDAFSVGQVPIDQQLTESAQLLEWARAAGTPNALLTAHRARVLALLAAGDLAGMDAEVVAFSRIAEGLAAPGLLWWVSLWGAMRALLEGRHDLAEERAATAFAIGRAPFASLAFTNFSFLMFFLRREQGRLAEMERATRDYVASQADVPAIRVSLALLLAELGRIDEARSGLRQFDDEALARLHDRNWPTSWFQLARVASVVGDGDVAARLLLPHHRPSESCVQVSLATASLGATDLAAAWLLHTVGDFDAGDVAYRSAAEINARIGARSWLAQTRVDHGRLLLERGRSGDHDEAARLLDLGRSAAREIGLATIDVGPMVSAVARTSSGTRDIGRDVGQDAGSGAGVFRRVGAVWELSFAGRIARVPDARGLRDLARLLARPGESVSVLELVDAPSSAAGARGSEALDERARREIREHLRRLDEEEAAAEADGDGERAAIVREQRQELAEVFARDFGLGGRPRRIGDPVERARKTVSTRIRRTITAIGQVHPELGRHLDRSVDTGTWCAYRPADEVTWQT